MGVQYQQGRSGVQSGFTIIEVILFLAISGLLMISLLGGWTTMIDTQRYKDSVKTLQAFVQQQYTLVYNVENTRDTNLTCINGKVDTVGPTIERGQSDCIIMGRYLYIDNGLKINVASITGVDLADTSDSDIDSILTRNPQRIDTPLNLTDNLLEIPWQAQVVDSSGAGRDIAIVIIRSPRSGFVHTYSMPVTGGIPPAVDAVVAYDPAGSGKRGASENNDLNLCLDAGSPLSGRRAGVVIKAHSSAQSFVQTITDDAICN